MPPNLGAKAVNGMSIGKAPSSNFDQSFSTPHPYGETKDNALNDVTRWNSSVDNSAEKPPGITQLFGEEQLPMDDENVGGPEMVALVLKKTESGIGAPTCGPIPLPPKTQRRQSTRLQF